VFALCSVLVHLNRLRAALNERLNNNLKQYEKEQKQSNKLHENRNFVETKILQTEHRLRSTAKNTYIRFKLSPDLRTKQP
jgi:hypothetical protein